MIAVFWDNLFNMDFVNGNILTYYEQTAHRFVIEWNGVTINSNGDSEGWAKFQVILYDPAYYNTVTGDGEIVMQYLKAEFTSSCTIGIENNALYAGIQYVYNDVYNPTASSIVAGRAIKFTTDPPFGTIITSTEDNNSFLNQTGDYIDLNEPNPFNVSTLINFHLSKKENISLCIFSINGELIKTLIDGHISSGNQKIRWDGTDNKGAVVSNGLYFARLQTENNSVTRKMVKIK